MRQDVENLVVCLYTLFFSLYDIELINYSHKICLIYMLHGERLLDVSLRFPIVLIIILVLSWDIVSRLDRRIIMVNLI